MKLLTLNTHSLQGGDSARELAGFTECVLREQPDVIALQEVNQSCSAPPVGADGMGMVPLREQAVPLREGNYALTVAQRLREAGVPCSWAWLPLKYGYETYEEGLAVLSLHAPVAGTNVVQVSRRDDFDDWRTRKALGIRLEGAPDWFYSVHTSWWGDPGEPFAEQWRRLDGALSETKKTCPVWLLGDFNAPAHLRGQSCDLVQASGWYDTYSLAVEKDSGITVEGVIAGWEGQRPVPGGMRIDYIWCSAAAPIRRSAVLFNGKNGPVISDHYGVLIETGGKGGETV